ncbi:Neutral alpha-glucosidase [Phytophthora cactorum]|uniref:Glucosidase II subunit alpha n=1 Tax=Phytophthora cactorum TaxID=29920 RepID=A0A8T1DLR1_9STRA|nr:Neutral alpha-glucosidase [Phytophthora cactorum]
MQSRWLFVLLTAAVLALSVHAVDRSKFRTYLDVNLMRLLVEDVAQKGGVPLAGSLAFLLNEDKAAVPALRVRLLEKFEDPKDPKIRWTSDDILVPAAEETRPLRQLTAQEAGLKTPINEEELGSFGVDLYLDGEVVMSTNDDGLFHYEIRQDRADAAAQTGAALDHAAVDAHGGKTIVDYGEDGLAIYEDGTVQKKKEHLATTTATVGADGNVEGWQESFGGHTDKKKFGPSSIGLDVSFHGSVGAPRSLYGIPEHATDFVLKDTIESSDKGGGKRKVVTDPYRLYNLDVFEYELDNPMALYGSIPVLVAPNKFNTVGMSWNNPSETFIDIWTNKEANTKSSHWVSESGVFDLFLLAGPSSADLFSQYTLITGRAQLPPLFALGYHQGRWNYKNEADVARVNAGFDEHLIPYDVLWLDIDHTDGRRYFTWDGHGFPTPKGMQESLAWTGRKTVTIFDPHIKVSQPKDKQPYYNHSEAEELGLFIKDEEGNDFKGWCWPGESSYIDFTSPKARAWWRHQFRYENYRESTKHLYTWNDMNEPSVFNGPEVTMRKGCTSLAGAEHREWHNLYGILFQRTTMEAYVGYVASICALARILCRLTALRCDLDGGQHGGVGASALYHQDVPVHVVVGLTFVGANVGGFFGNSSSELLTRWNQAATYQPFVRGHSHQDSARREPWMFGEPTTSRIRATIRERYALLPYIYTVFRTCYARGMPVMRPLWAHFTQEPQSFSEEDQYLLGDALLVKPIVEKGVEATHVFLPTDNAEDKTVWYQVTDGNKRFFGGKTYENVPAPLDAIPVFHRGGTILPRKQRLEGEGTLVSFQQTKEGLRSTATAATSQGKRYTSLMWAERIVVYGFQSESNLPKQVLVDSERALDFQYDAANDRLVLRKPQVPVTDDWELRFV